MTTYCFLWDYKINVPVPFAGAPGDPGHVRFSERDNNLFYNDVFEYFDLLHCFHSL